MAKSVIKKTATSKKEFDIKARDRNGDLMNGLCRHCNTVKPKSKFYKDYNPKNASGLTIYCKDCCAEIALAPDGIFNKKGLINLLKDLDKPYKNTIYQKVLNGDEYSDEAKVGSYLRFVNGVALRNLKFENSDAESQKSNTEEITLKDNKLDDISRAKELFGTDYESSELLDMLAEFDGLRENYPLKTKMHERALIQVCKLSLRYNQSIVKNDTSSMKEYGSRLEKAQENAGINPNNLKQSDLNGGLDCFSRLVEEIEKTKGVVVPIPNVMKEPQDYIDYAIWVFIDYIQDLAGFPKQSYQQVYSFIEKHNKEYADKYKEWLKMPENAHWDERDYKLDDDEDE